jgi:TonB family protein
MPQASKRRLVGLDKDTVQDQNRFGIFAGEDFELPHMKEIVQKAPLTQEDVEGPTTEQPEQARTLEVNTQIEGPLRGRTIVYKPPPPQLNNIENEVALQLKFWVLPDGTIGEVIPLKRGDAQLERIAIAYLKKWQFEALTPDAPQEKIWGTIPIVFTAQ